MRARRLLSLLQMKPILFTLVFALSFVARAENAPTLAQYELKQAELTELLGDISSLKQQLQETKYVRNGAVFASVSMTFYSAWKTFDPFIRMRFRFDSSPRDARWFQDMQNNAVTYKRSMNAVKESTAYSMMLVAIPLYQLNNMQKMLNQKEAEYKESLRALAALAGTPVL